MLSILLERARTSERAGDMDEALARYEDAFARVGREGDAAQAAEILRSIGTVHLRRSALDLAEEVYEASLAIAEASGLREKEAKVLTCMAGIAHARGDSDRAGELYQVARDRAEELSDQLLTSMVDMNLGSLANLKGDMGTALERYTDALQGFQILGDGRNSAYVLNNMGMAHLDLGDWNEAEMKFGQSADLALAAEDTELMGTVELNRAELYLEMQRFDEARECCARSLATFSRLGSKTAVGEAYKLQGILHRELGKREQANSHFALALGLAEVAGDRLLQAETQIEWAVLLLRWGRDQEGVRYLNRSLRLFEEIGARREIRDIQRRLERVEDLYLPAVKGWSAKILQTVPHQAEHAARVAEYSRSMGRLAGLDGWELTVLQVGALIHDIGKTLVPLQLEDEYHAIRAVTPTSFLQVHAIAGYSLVRQLDFPAEVQTIVRNHHEQHEGEGYPDRLSGDRISFATRIVMVADAFDSLVRPTGARTPLPVVEALRIMELDAGRVFDRQALALLREILPERQDLEIAA